MLTEEVINLGGCTARSLHHDKPYQSGFSLVHLHGNRASSGGGDNCGERRRGEVDGGGRRGVDGESICCCCEDSYTAPPSWSSVDQQRWGWTVPGLGSTDLLPGKHLICLTSVSIGVVLKTRTPAWTVTSVFCCG